MTDVLILYTTEKRLFYFDFTSMPEIIAGDTISSATVTATPSGLTLGSPSVSGGKVAVQINGGTDGQLYIVTCVATLASGNKLTAPERLRVAAQ